MIDNNNDDDDEQKMDAKSYDSDSNEDDEIQQEKMEKFLLSLNNIKYRSKRRTKFQRINSPPTPILELNYTRPTKMNGLKSSKLTVRMKNPNRRRKKTVQKKRSTMKMNYKTIDDDFDVDEPVQRRRPSRLSRLSRNFQSINRQRLEPKRSVSLSKTSLKRAREMFVKHLEQIILESMSKIVQQQKQIDREISSLRSSNRIKSSRSKIRSKSRISSSRSRIKSSRSRITTTRSRLATRPKTNIRRTKSSKIGTKRRKYRGKISKKQQQVNRLWKSMTKIPSHRMIITPDGRRAMPREEIDKIIKTINMLKSRSDEDDDDDCNQKSLSPSPSSARTKSPLINDDEQPKKKQQSSNIVDSNKNLMKTTKSLSLDQNSDEKLLNTIDKNVDVDSESKLFKTFEFKTDPKINRNGFGGKFMKKNVIIRCSENIDTFKTNESTTTTTTDIDKKNDDKISKQKSLNKEVENCSATSIDC